MDEKLFRKKSLEKMQSPESLHDYVQVANPGIWLILCAVIALLIGACVWGIYGRIETKTKGTAQALNGTVVCSVSPEDMPKMETGMMLRIGQKQGEIYTLDEEKLTVTADMPVTDGEYSAYIILESIQPLSFVFN